MELTEEEQKEYDRKVYEREAKEAERIDEFYEGSAACEAAGYVVIIDRWGSAPRRACFKCPLPPPRRGERWYCMNPSDIERMMHGEF